MSAITAAQPSGGEWVLDRSGQYSPPCIRMHGILIALLPDNGTNLMWPAAQRAQDRANAALLRAARELLDACRAYADADSQCSHSGRCECLDAAGDQIRAALKAAAAPEVRACRTCGCTDDYCAWCIEKTGHPCRWVEADLCSACVPHQLAKRKGRVKP